MTGRARRPSAATTLGLVGAFALLAAGCESAVERLTESAAEQALGAMTEEDVDVDLRDGSLSIEGADGESFSVGATTEVPDRIAAIAPIPAGFEPASTFQQSDDGQQGVTVSGTVPADDVGALLDDFEATMTADGWEQISRTNINDEILSLGLQRGDDVFTVSVMSDGTDVMLTLMLIEQD